MESTTRGDEYTVSDAVAPSPPCREPNPDVVSECGQFELPSSIHTDDEDDHDAFFVQTCVGEVENAEEATPQKPLFSTGGEEPLVEDWDRRSRLRRYVDSKRRFVAKRLLMRSRGGAWRQDAAADTQASRQAKHCAHRGILIYQSLLGSVPLCNKT